MLNNASLALISVETDSWILVLAPEMVSNIVCAGPRTRLKPLRISMLERVADIDQQLPRLIDWLVPVRRIFVRNGRRTLLNHKLLPCTAIKYHVFAADAALHIIRLQRYLPDPPIRLERLPRHHLRPSLRLLLRPVLDRYVLPRPRHRVNYAPFQGRSRQSWRTAGGWEKRRMLLGRGEVVDGASLPAAALVHLLYRRVPADLHLHQLILQRRYILRHIPMQSRKVLAETDEIVRRISILHFFCIAGK